VNGDYERSEEVCNGRAMYTKVGNAATRCTHFTCVAGAELLYMCPQLLCKCLELLYMSGGTIFELVSSKLLYVSAATYMCPHTISLSLTHTHTLYVSAATYMCPHTDAQRRT
jgi:hypothetical protein